MEWNKTLTFDGQHHIPCVGTTFCFSPCSLLPPFEDWTTASLRRLPRSLRSLDSTDTIEGYYSHLLNLLSPFLAVAGLFISNILYIMVYRSTQQIHQYYLETIGLCIFLCVCVYII